MAIIPTLILLVLTGATALAQQSPRPEGFIDFRYASRTSLTLFAGYQSGGTVLLAGMVQNPRTDYREVVAGLGRPIGSGAKTATIVLAGAYASDGWYGQLYLVPALRFRRLVISGVLLAYEPLERQGTRQLHVNPINALVVIRPDIHFGISYTLAAPEGGVARHAAGPSVRIITNGWSASLTGLGGFGPNTGEVRMVLATQF
jgi:hypothetical protein